MDRFISFSSQFYHFLNYSLTKPKRQLENGMILIIIDVDVGSRQLGVINSGKNDLNIHRYYSEYFVGEIEEIAVPLIVKILNDFEIGATFAIRGQLTEVKDSVLELLIKSSNKHEIGAHGYYHREFSKLSRNEADRELGMIKTGMKKFGLNQQSFVFPKNAVAHLDLLEKYSYKCYRSHGNFLTNSMYIEREGQLYNIHPSLYLYSIPYYSFLKKILDIAVQKKLPFNIWFHPWSFGEKRETIRRALHKIFLPLLEYAKKKETEGLLTFETMLSATKKVEKLGE